MFDFHFLIRRLIFGGAKKSSSKKFEFFWVAHVDMHDYFNWELKNGYIDMAGCWTQNDTKDEFGHQNLKIVTISDIIDKLNVSIKMVTDILI